MANTTRMLNKAREYTVGTYLRKFVAPEFQRMIRAEWGACVSGLAIAVVEGKIAQVPRQRGQCVCVTCGKVSWWSGGLRGMHTGHFLASRRSSIVLVEDNTAPQCASCNRFRNGMPVEFELWMREVRGQQTIDWLRQLKATTKRFSREELVDFRVEYKQRLRRALTAMK